MVSEETRLFTAWESFYVIVGSSGAALTCIAYVATEEFKDPTPGPDR